MISIIIVTYNSQELIKDCIESVYKHNDITNIEIIVVDNSPSLGALMIKSIIDINFKSVKYIHSGGNIGYGAGNNIGIKEAEGDIICIMNPDVRLIEPLFKEVEVKFSVDSKLGIFSYKQLGGRNFSFYLKQEYNMSFLTPFIIILFNRVNLFLSKFFFLSGAFFFINKSYFINIGLFDENIFMYNEESDISQRMLNARYRIKYDRKKVFKHLIDERSSINDTSFEQRLKSNYYYFNKYNFSFRAYILKNILSFKISKLVSLIKNDEKRYHDLNAKIEYIKANYM